MAVCSVESKAGLRAGPTVGKMAALMVASRVASMAGPMAAMMADQSGHWLVPHQEALSVGPKADLWVALMAPMTAGCLVVRWDSVTAA